ncbi:isocitrate/isopropylmalate dehydrogenase [Desulfosporosinus acidiphilus SJ4]|uniref:Isocitrate/isopropylmalate dehydrogenase n=1 Tax=Desulfosporosinus acidiphilus (strain DSM 22704 / JCM 16185 / SJ4) TaxID=646529 RepID=I4D374_DESAJ|nr:isocitrate/isopropylmalate dehydrogenase family protein [Desulfosporosinus acidiphilus]AFM40248.1 isocitrate/isopropylmalate dehydrogenase [Desulfosporosinus acidiphilus SJ4]
MTVKVTLIPGDGIGPEVSAATQKVITASQAPLDWEVVEAGEACIEKYGTPLPEHVLETIRRNKVAIKGPITTPVGKGFRSVNVALRQQLQLYANVRHLRNLPNVPSKYQDVDIVVVRENTEDLYAGIEHKVGNYAAESIKVITRDASERIGRYAFELARREGRKRVTIVHKANIMKLSDGLFLESIRHVARDFPEIECEDRIIDALCMNLVQVPEQFDVLVLPNLYGDIVSDLVAGLVGGLGVAPGANIGEMGAVFEAVHGSAPQIAGKNIANPLAMILSGIEMLKYLGFIKEAQRVEKGINDVLSHREYVTPDLGGTSGTQEMAMAIVESMK